MRFVCFVVFCFAFFFLNQLCNRGYVFAVLLGDAAGFIYGLVKKILCRTWLKKCLCYKKYR